MDEVKRNLRDARDRIEKKDFEEAIKFIKNVLKHDKNNYMALVLLGVAFQDAAQASLAYKKAIALHRDKPLAWQGLASYLERNRIISDELIEAYIVLSSIENDLLKYQEICDKIRDACIKLNSIECCSSLYEHAVTLEIDAKRNIFYKTFMKVVSSIILPEDSMTMDFLHKVFELNKENPCGEDFDEKFFEYFIRVKGFDYVINMYNYYIKAHSKTKLSDLILRSYVKHYIDTNMFLSHQQQTQTADVFIELMQNLSQSQYFPMVESLLMFSEGDFYDAYCAVHKVGISFDENENTLLNIIVGNICLKLGRWLEAEQTSIHQPVNISQLFKRRLLKIKFVSLSLQNIDHKCREALELVKDVESDMDEDEVRAFYLAHIYLKDLITAEKYLTVLRKINVPDYIPLKCLFLENVGKEEEALIILNQNKESWPLCWLPIAKHYMELEKFEDALVPLLQAAKADRYNCTIFLYLGDYYSLADFNPEKANKCYLKSFTLNPECEKAGKCLSNTYRNLKRWETNYEFLKQLSSTQNNQNSWTWLELGLHHFALEEWDAAIVNLRTYVRLETDDVEAWESLADAYYSRGSFTSALKCYQRTIKLNPSKKYSIVQIGAVQCLLGDYTEALKTFNSISDETFLPALKGLGDAYLAIANDKLSHNLFANCRDNCQQAIYYITKALLNENQFVCLWTSLSGAILMIAKLPPKYRWLYVNSRFWIQQDKESDTMLRNNDLFSLAAQCVCRAIALADPVNSCLYYDLAMVYLDYYKYSGNMSGVQKAYLAITNCIKIDQGNCQYWNLFGVICMSKDIKKYSLAQHAFLKAVNIEFCNAMVWSNLGVNYLFFGHVMLANRAFQKAQQFNPSFMASWIGQALIAESVDHSDAMGLFLHSSQLGFHTQSILGYAECVCKNLFSKQVEYLSKVEYSMKNMHAVPIACDLMSWLIEYEENNPYCLNIIGILLEKMGLLNNAIRSYESALSLVESQYEDIVRSNYGRALYRAGKYDAAMKVFKDLKEEQLFGYCGLALCLGQLGKYQEAYDLYGTAFQWLANNDYEKAQLLVALASMAYKSNDVENCKTLIYQCIEENSLYIYIPVVLAGFALSALTSDNSLYQVITGNLHKLNKKQKFLHYVALFKSYELYQRKNVLQAIREIQNFIHILPNDVNFWRFLSHYSSSDSFAYPLISSASAQKIISMDDSKLYLIDNYRIASLAEACLGNVSKALKFAQKAIHLFPNKGDNWALLIYAYTRKKKIIHNVQWLKRVIEFVKTNTVLNKFLMSWLEFFECNSHNLL